jgi:putative FmdB family regulatory protein
MAECCARRESLSARPRDDGLFAFEKEDSMPTYEYQCDGCGHRFEEFQQISDEPLKSCPKCHKRKLRRLIGAGAAVIFKGAGFYETDYRSKQYSEDKSKAEAGAAPRSSDAKKCESCPKNKE